MKYVNKHPRRSTVKSETTALRSGLVSLSKQLIRIKSEAGRSKDLKKALNLIVKKLKGFTIERFERNGSLSILAYAGKKRPKRFRILLNGHLDVVPGKPEQYEPFERRGKLYGVGSMDMKSNVVCLLATFRKLGKQLNYPIGLQIVTDEEIGGFDGTLYQVEKGVRADLVIAGESTQFDIVHQAKGVFQGKIHFYGKTAHGAYPWRGINAAWELKRFLDRLEKEFVNPNEQSWVTTLNLSSIETSNRHFNKIPDYSAACFDIRFVPGDGNKVVARLKKLLPKNAKLEVYAHEAALFVPLDNQLLRLLANSVRKITGDAPAFRASQGTSDSRHFQRVRCPGIEFGPIGGEIGADREWVDVKSLESFCDILEHFLRAL